MTLILLRRPSIHLIGAILLPTVLFLFSLSALASDKSSNLSNIFGASPILPIPQGLDLAKDKVALGKKLFSDPRLSRSGNSACTDCHRIDMDGADGLKLSATNSGPDLFNATTIFNSGLRPLLTWRGAFRSLEEQAEADLHNPRHANTSWKQIVSVIKADRAYVIAFNEIYGDVTRDAILDAIATFERSLITPNAPFDKYLRGDANAITVEEKQGYELFKNYGCIACHQGMNIGGNLFQKIGIFEDYFRLRGGAITVSDLGRYSITKREEDKHVFRVPSLRNVAVTPPYFHDGSIENLEDAVTMMARIQLGRRIPEQDVELIVKFLKTLTGEYLGRPLQTRVND